MWPRDCGLGIETVSRPKNAGFGIGLRGTGLGLGFEGEVLVLEFRSWSWRCGFVSYKNHLLIYYDYVM